MPVGMRAVSFQVDGSMTLMLASSELSTNIGGLVLAGEAATSWAREYPGRHAEASATAARLDDRNIAARLRCGDRNLTHHHLLNSDASVAGRGSVGIANRLFAL